MKNILIHGLGQNSKDCKTFGQTGRDEVFNNE